MNLLEAVRPLTDAVGITTPADPHKATRALCSTPADLEAEVLHYRKLGQEFAVAEEAVRSGDKSPAYLERFRHAMHVSVLKQTAIRTSLNERRNLAPPAMIDKVRRLKRDLMQATTRRNHLVTNVIPESDRELKILEAGLAVAKGAHAVTGRDAFSVKDSAAILARAESNLAYAKRERENITEEVDELAEKIFNLEAAHKSAREELFTV